MRFEQIEQLPPAAAPLLAHGGGRGDGDDEVELLTAFVLWIASLAVRRMQISYGTET